MERVDEQLLLNTCMLVGKIMLSSGSESYRVEDTMIRIAHSSGYFRSESYITNTAVLMSLNEVSKMQMAKVMDRGTHMAKIDATNQLSRQYAAGKITLEALYVQLQLVDKETPGNPLWLRIICSGIASMTLMIILGGQYHDMPLAFICGALGYFISTYLSLQLEVTYLNDFIATIFLTTTAIVFYTLGWVSSIDYLIAGSIMPLVPGLAITGALRDLFSGQLISGFAQLLNCLLISTVIGVGVAGVWHFFLVLR